MDDKRLTEIEHGFMHYGPKVMGKKMGTTAIETEQECIAEIRRLRGIVDGLLGEWPWRRTTQGRICPACQSFETYCHCMRKQVADARDWEPQKVRDDE